MIKPWLLNKLSSDDPDFFLGGTATAQSDYGASYVASKANDGSDTGTQWHSGNGLPQWWKCDLGAGVTKTGIRLRFLDWYDASGNAIKDFNVQGSNDDSSWDTLYTGQRVVGSPNAYTEYTWSNTTGYRYYKINITTSWRTNQYTGALEFRLFEA